MNAAFPLRAFLLAALVGGCSVIGPTGTNKSTTAIVAPDENGFIVLKFKPTGDAQTATFRVTNLPADSTFQDQIDDSPDGGKEGDPCETVTGEFCVAFQPGDLTSNVYLVDVILDEEAAATDAEGEEGEEDEEAATTGTKAGTLAFVVNTDAAASGDEEEGGDEEGGDEEADGDDEEAES